MDLLDRLLMHDAWTTRKLLELASDLSDVDLDRDFGIGPRTVRATARHIVRNMEVWTDLMVGNPRRPDGGDSIPDLIGRLDVAADDLSGLARSIETRGAWDERWVDHECTPPKERSFGGSIAHVITHSMHHRVQLITMLRRLGVPQVPEGDVLSWEHTVERTPNP